MADRNYAFETLALHAGQVPDAATGSRAVPLYQTTSYVFDSAEHAASLFNLQTFGNVYTRLSNPTTAVFEERIAALEGGRAALATASGLAAQMTALLTLLKTGDHVVAASTLYGGTYSQFAVNLDQLGIQTTFVDPDDPENFRRAITRETKVIYAETLGNPLINVLDIEAVANIAHAAGLPLMIDNTVASPFLCRPFEWGADIVVHSATKYIGGHGTTMGGVIVESGKFPWDNGNFPNMTEPSRGYHGVRFYETFGDFGFTMKCRMETLRTFGAALSPFNAWMLLQGCETLHVRMERHVSNAQRVAEFLEAHPHVSWVSYPGLKAGKYHALGKKYLPRGASALMTFGVKGGLAAGEKFIDAAQFMSHLANIGDAKTLVIHPGSTTHRQLSEEEQIKAGVSPDMIRLSVGIENVDDILWDLDQALAASQTSGTLK
jgi:O-acetylhomoserine (thiol)-lyase